MNDKVWFGGTKYMSLEKNPGTNKLINDLIPYLQEMFAKVNGSKETLDLQKIKSGSTTEKIYNKTSAAELAIAVGSIVNKYSRDIVIENLVDAASSARISAGTRPEQIEARRKQLGGKVDKDFESLPVKVAKLVFTSCFHLKIS
jgi:ribonuclease HII